MYLASPRLRLTANTSSLHPTASPPPAPLSITTAFFESPFSVSNHTSSTLHPQLSPPPPLSLSDDHHPPIMTPPISAGFKVQRLMTGLGEDGRGDENLNPSHHLQLFTSTPPSTIRSSSEWTPLSSRTNSVHNQIISYDSKLSSTEDRLDRLLAEMEPDNPVSSSSTPSLSIIKNPNHPSPCSTPPQKLDCWELSSLETRFQPIHHTSSSTHSSPLRPCLKTRSTSISSNRSSISFPQSIDPSPTDSRHDLEFIPSDHHHHDHHLELDQDRSIKVRFDDDQIEEILTWSRESYDRKGPQPITKLNVREIIELRLIKEELGISPSTPIRPTSTSTSPSSSTSDSTTL